MRELDTLDYLFVAAITVLAYLQLPWRPAIRGWLRALVRSPLELLGGSLQGSELLVASVVVTLTLFIVFVSTILPRFERAN